MSKQKKRKELVYKDSNIFEYTPKYEYPASILNRFLFFWDTWKHYRKAINNALAFQKPNNICVVYLVGNVKIEQVAKYIEGKEQILILYSNTVQPIIDEYEADREYRQRVINAYGRNNIDELDKTFKKYSDAVDNGYWDKDNSFFIQLTHEYNAIHNEQNIIDKFQYEWFHSLKAIGCFNGSIDGEQNGHITALTNIAKSIFPFGIEAANPQPIAYKSARREKLTISGLSKESQFGFKPSQMDDEQSPVILMYDKKKYKDTQDKQMIVPISTYQNKEEASKQTGIDYNAIWRCCVGRTVSVKYGENRVSFEERYNSESIPYLLVQHIRKEIHDRLYRQGYVSINSFKQEICKPPYGYYESNWYTYLFAVSISDLNQDGKHMVQLGCAVFNLDFQSLKYSAMVNLNDGKIRRSYDAILLKQNDKQNKTMDMVKRLFGIKDDVDSFQSLMTKVRIFLTENVQFGLVDFAFPELHEIISGSSDDVYISQGYEKKLYDLLKSNYKEIKFKVNNIDDITYQSVKEKYNTSFIDKYIPYVKRIYNRKGHARSWSWSKNTLFDEVEYVNSHAQCCECEKVIDTEVLKDENGKDLIFHDKDIIGINRKIFGRNITKFYCISCMCEILECNPKDIAERIEHFKEEGCKLFG